MHFPGCPGHKNPPCNAKDTGSIPGLGKFHMLWSNGTCVPQLLNPHSRAHAMQHENPQQWENLAPQGKVALAHSN